MGKIVPAILEPTIEAALEKLRLIAAYTEWVQFDIMDNSLFRGFTWREPDDLAKVKELFGADLKIDIHLLLSQPQLDLAKWYQAGADRVIFHIESQSSAQLMFETARKAGKEIGAALNPATPWQKIAGTASQFDEILFMSVMPGAQGREFVPEVLDKMREFRAQFPEVLIGIDGGIGLENVKQAVQAGADILYVGSAMWRSSDPVAIFRQLERIANEDGPR